MVYIIILLLLYVPTLFGIHTLNIEQLAQVTKALTFDDILLVPAYSTVLPKDVCIKTKLTKTIDLNIPFTSAAMDTVTEWRLAVALAQEGGIGFIHKNMSIEEQVAQVKRVKKFESGIIRDPITVTPQTTIREVRALTQMHHISGVPVVESKQLVGLVTSRDMRFETNLDQSVSHIMTPKERLITVKEGASQEDITALLHRHRIEKILIVNNQFELCGMVTVKDIQHAHEKPNACKDRYGRLRVGASVGCTEYDKKRVQQLIEAGVDVLVVDTSHGHAHGVLDMVTWIKQHYTIPVIGGNIATAQAAQALVAAGVDGVKVGIGPGSICTTRIVTGVGVPQISAIATVAQALCDTGIPIIADGGIRYSGDVCKALAAGASVVMIGSLFAGTQEAPGEIELYQGRAYKSYRGMGSLSAMGKSYGSSDRYFQDVTGAKLVPEGIEGRVAYKGSLHDVVYQLVGGLRSCMGYLGCSTVAMLHNSAQFIRITNAGLKESHVHDVHIIKEAPNYWMP